MIDAAILFFKNGIIAHLVQSGPESHEYEVICEHGSVSALNNGKEWTLRIGSDPAESQPAEFPSFEPHSPTRQTIQDLVQAIEAGHLGHLAVSHRGMEIALALAQSHLEEGRRVPLPITNRGLYVPSY